MDSAESQLRAWSGRNPSAIPNSSSNNLNLSVPPAIVIWWNEKICCARCPYCYRQHSHATAWKNGSPVVDHTDACDFTSHLVTHRLRYRPLYPFQEGHREVLSWEIEKESGRFITVGIQKRDEDRDTDYSEYGKSEDFDSEDEPVGDKPNSRSTASPRPSHMRRSSTQSISPLAGAINRLGVDDLDPDLESLLSRMEDLGMVEPKTDACGDDYFAGNISSPLDMRKRIAAEQMRRNLPGTPKKEKNSSRPSTPVKPLPTPPASPEPRPALGDIISRMDMALQRAERYSRGNGMFAALANSDVGANAQPTTRPQNESPSASILTPSTPPNRTPTPRAVLVPRTEPRRPSGGVDLNSLNFSSLSIDDIGDQQSSTWITFFDEGIDELLKTQQKRLKARFLTLVRIGDTEALRLLLERSENDIPALRDRKDNTGMMIAARYGFTEIIRILHDAKRSLRYVNARNKAGRTALMEAAMWGHLDAVELLLSIGADVNVEDAKDRTAVHFASRSVRVQRERQQRNSSLDQTYSQLPSFVKNAIIAHLHLYTSPTAHMANAPTMNDFTTLPEVYTRQTSTTKSFFKNSDLGSTTTHTYITTKTETTHYRLREQYKGVGRLLRGSPFDQVAVLSGWNQPEYSPEHVVDQSVWTEKARFLCHRYLGYGGPGRASMEKKFASHVETQLVAYYIDKHVLLDGDHTALRSVMPPQPVLAELLINKYEPCPSCEEFLERVKDRLHLKITCEKTERNDNLKIKITA